MFRGIDQPWDCSQPIKIGEREFSVQDSRPYVYLWPAAVALAARIAAEQPKLGACCEVGCGTGLVGIVAKQFAESVVLIDSNERACAVARHNAAVNEARAIALPLAWDKVHIPFDSIVGASIIYPPHDLIGLAKFISRNWSHKRPCLFANVDDHAGEQLQQALTANGLTWTKIECRHTHPGADFPYFLWEVK